MLMVVLCILSFANAIVILQTPHKKLDAQTGFNTHDEEDDAGNHEDHEDHEELIFRKFGFPVVDSLMD